MQLSKATLLGQDGTQGADRLHKRTPRAGSAGASSLGGQCRAHGPGTGDSDPSRQHGCRLLRRVSPGTTLHRRVYEKRPRRPLQSIRGSGSAEHQTGFKPHTSSFPPTGRLPCTRQLSGQRSRPCWLEPHDTGRCPGCGPLVDAGGAQCTWGRNSEWRVSGAPGWAPEPGMAPGHSRAGKYGATAGEDTATPLGSPEGHGGRPGVCLAVSWAPFPGTLLPPGHWSQSPVESGRNDS